ncbi:hypothetical protein ACST14_02615 [Aquirufa sp. A-Brett2-15D]
MKKPYNYVLGSFLVLVLLAFDLKAQIVLKNHMDNELYVKYSKSIDLFQENVNLSKDSLTIFLAPNYSVFFLKNDKYEDVFVQKLSLDVLNFLQNHQCIGLLSMDVLKSIMQVDKSKNFLELNSSKKLFFDLNGLMVLLSNDFRPQFVQSESNIEKSIIINHRISINFLQGVIQY